MFTIKNDFQKFSTKEEVKNGFVMFSMIKNWWFRGRKREGTLIKERPIIINNQLTTFDTPVYLSLSLPVPIHYPLPFPDIPVTVTHSPSPLPHFPLWLIINDSQTNCQNRRYLKFEKYQIFRCNQSWGGGGK